MKIVGLTGGIACGKSTVLAYFQSFGVQCLSADQIVHNLMSDSKSEVYSSILKEFGEQILTNEDEIDREKLGGLVFGNFKQLEKLENILHPEVKKEFEKWVAENKDEEIIVYEIPLLFEKNRQADFDSIICVFADEKTQIQRLKKRNNLSLEQANLRLQSQLPVNEKKLKSQILIDNGDIALEELKKQVQKAIKELTKPKSSHC